MRLKSIRRFLNAENYLTRVRDISRHCNIFVFILKLYTSFKRWYDKKVIDIWVLIDYCIEFSDFFYEMR